MAVTNGDAHLADLMVEAGGRPLVSQFSTENGAATLRRHFAQVVRHDIATRARFDDHQEAVRYLATFDEQLAAGLQAFRSPREYAGATSVFVARVWREPRRMGTGQAEDCARAVMRRPRPRE